MAALGRTRSRSRSGPQLQNEMATPISRRRVLVTASLTAMALLPRPSAAEEEPRCLDRLLARRRMIRKFRRDPVSDDVVRRIVRSAMRAPSAGHTQPWNYVVVRDAAIRRRLARAALSQMFVSDAPVVIVPCADRALSRSRYGGEGDRYAVIDTAFSSLLLLLAVVEEGLGACFVGAFHEEQVSQILDLPDPVRPLAVVPVGVPAERPGRLKLRPLEQVLHLGRW
jgi:nitroreductase